MCMEDGVEGMNAESRKETALGNGMGTQYPQCTQSNLLLHTIPTQKKTPRTIMQMIMHKGITFGTKTPSTP